MPGILGGLLMADGLGWATYLWQPAAVFLFPAIAAVGALAEFPLQIWVIVMGVNNERWAKQAQTAGPVAADGAAAV